MLAMVLLCLAASASVLAAPPAQTQPGDEQCSSCHGPESNAWEKSPHAQQGVKCETCHGPYVPEHPDKGVMQLTSDPKVCISCHAETENQWKESLHAKSGINCVNCHVPHAQTTRLSSEKLCCACHSGGSEGMCQTTAHKAAGINCVDCHLSGTVGGTTSGHSFTAVAGQICLDCHNEELHLESSLVPSAFHDANMTAAANCTENTAAVAQVPTMRKQNTALQSLAVIMLGVGLGIGMFLGLIVALVLGYLSRNHQEATS